MHTLYKRKPLIPALYVKSAPQTYDIRTVFMKARQMSPCLLILEDIETIVTPQTRSYFFNEVICRLKCFKIGFADLKRLTDLRTTTAF